jgi:hypothetical protein
MPKAKLLVAACFALFALSVPATANAGWIVSGKALAAGESKPLATHALVLTTGELKVLTANFAIKCSGHEVGIEGGKIVGTDGILVKSISFKACKGSNTCTNLENEEIKTVPIHGKAILDGTLNAYISLLPETKTTFATIKFIDAECALLGTQLVTGGASILVHEAAHEKIVHLGLAFSLPKALRVGSDEADLRGLSFDIALESNEPWSFV